MTQCKYKRIGCPWQGPFHELPAHESECSHPTKTGTELMGILGEMDQSHRRDMQLYNSIFSLLCYEKIGFTGTSKKEEKLLYTRKTAYIFPLLFFYHPTTCGLFQILSSTHVSFQRCSSGRTALMTSSLVCTMKHRASLFSTRRGC